MNEKLIASLKARYAEPTRAYHVWQHIEAMLKWIESAEFQLHDAEVVRWAVYYHDSIYESTSKENEERSAQMAEIELATVLPPQRLANVAIMIRGTSAHRMVSGLDANLASDLAHFLDMDLSILGADPKVFDTYELNIRAEYSHFPDEIYLPGRLAVLKSFVQRETLYFSDWGRCRFETRALENLQRSIETINQKLI